MIEEKTQEQEGTHVAGDILNPESITDSGDEPQDTSSPDGEGQETPDPEQLEEEQGEDPQDEQPEEEPQKSEDTPDEPEKASDEPEEEPDEPKEEPEGKLSDSTRSLVGKYLPDEEFDNDQDALQALQDKVDADLDRLKQNDKANKELVQIFQDHPDLVDLIHLVQRGATVAQALPFITGEKDPISDLSENEEEWAKQAKEKASEREKRKKGVEEIKANTQKSFKAIDDFAKKNKMDQESTKSFLGEVDRIYTEISRGQITEDTLNRLLKGISYDKDLKEEAEKAEIRGRNEGIDQVKGKDKKGDKLPHLKSKATQEGDVKEDTPEQIFGRNIESWDKDRPF